MPQTEDASQLLQYAVEKGRTDIVRALLDQGALEQIQRAGEAVEPALHTACRLGHEDVVRALLSCEGVDPSVSWDGRLALECATRPQVAVP